MSNMFDAYLKKSDALKSDVLKLLRRCSRAQHDDPGLKQPQEANPLCSEAGEQAKRSTFLVPKEKLPFGGIPLDMEEQVICSVRMLPRDSLNPQP